MQSAIVPERGKTHPAARNPAIWACQQAIARAAALRRCRARFWEDRKAAMSDSGGELVINLKTTPSDGEAVRRRECSCFCTGTLFRTSELLLWRGHLLGFGSLAILGYNFCASRFPRQFIGEGVRNVNLPKRLLDAT